MARIRYPNLLLTSGVPRKIFQSVQYRVFRNSNSLIEVQRNVETPRNGVLIIPDELVVTKSRVEHLLHSEAINFADGCSGSHLGRTLYGSVRLYATQLDNSHRDHIHSGS